MGWAPSSRRRCSPERLSLKDHPEFNERWLQDRLWDLLLQDPESTRRYEVEIQLGPTDKAHIIRTIEHWDIERKRYPQYDHAAVIVAEDITSRFLNVISPFNGAIPLTAIQLAALRLGEHVSLLFTTVLDEVQLGPVDEDEEVRAVTDRA